MADQTPPTAETAVTVEPYPHRVEIMAQGVTLARTDNAVLRIETHAPDIYVPASDITPGVLEPSETPDDADHLHYFDGTIEGTRTPRMAWQQTGKQTDERLLGCYAFDFDKVTIDVDGTRVRGHVRDPHKRITVTPVVGRLRFELGGVPVIETDAALLLEETGLPARYYVPADDVAARFLVPSDRQSVCTYKGEATYHHLQAGERTVENAVWTYDAPWTDFATDIGLIAGHRGFYTSVFDRVLLNDEDIGSDAEAAADQAMIATPTIDAALRDKLSGTS